MNSQIQSGKESAQLDIRDVAAWWYVMSYIIEIYQ